MSKCQEGKSKYTKDISRWQLEQKLTALTNPIGKGMMARISFTNALLGLLLLATATHAQFGFFEQMFGFGGHEDENEERGNVPSDSDWYQRTYDGGKCVGMALSLRSTVCPHQPANCLPYSLSSSPMLQLSLPRNT